MSCDMLCFKYRYSENLWENRMGGKKIIKIFVGGGGAGQKRTNKSFQHEENALNKENKFEKSPSI